MKCSMCLNWNALSIGHSVGHLLQILSAGWVCSNVHSLSPSFAFPFPCSWRDTIPSQTTLAVFHETICKRVVNSFLLQNTDMEMEPQRLANFGHATCLESRQSCIAAPFHSRMSFLTRWLSRWEKQLHAEPGAQGTLHKYTIRVESWLTVFQFLLFQFSFAVFHLKYTSYHGIVAMEQLHRHLHGSKHSDVHWCSNKPIYLMVRNMQYVLGKLRIGDGRIKCKDGKGPTFHLVKENKSWSIHIRKIAWN